MFTDMSPAELQAYTGISAEPDDFDDFWRRTLDEARAAAAGTPVRVERVTVPIESVDVYDVTFPGWGGEPVKAWLRTPKDLAGPARTLVQFVGYGCGRGHVLEDLLWSSSGYVHLIVDNRGSGGRSTQGDTGDSGDTGPTYPGLMTRGIRSPETSYYRRLLTDAVLAVDAAAGLPFADRDRIGVFGLSQGGGMSLAAAALHPLVKAVHAKVPFLSDFRRAAQHADTYPYNEIAGYLAIHRHDVETVFRTLSYMDVMNFSRRIAAPGLFAVALCDDIVPPSTVYAAYNAYAGPKDLRVWEFNGHECGKAYDDADGLAFFARHLRAGESREGEPR